MRFIVSSTQLLKKLQVIGSVGSNNTLPILENFLFELSKNKLTISASDLETTIKGEIDIETESEGSIAVPSKFLINILKDFPEQPLTFIVKEDNSMEIISGNGKYKLPYISGEEFPKAIELQNPNTTSISGEILAEAIQKTIFATGNDDLRPVMSGVFFQFSQQGATFVATDAHKLVKYERADVVSQQLSEFIMPKKTLNVLKGILSGNSSEVTIEYNENNARFLFDQMEVICRLIDGKYPNYEAVIPKENPNRLIIERSVLLNASSRASNFSNKSTNQIRLKMAGTLLELSAEDIEYGNSAKESITCNYEGDDMEIGFNSKFLIEMLKNLSSDQVLLEMSEHNRPGLLTPVDGLDEGEKVVMLVMPTMLEK